MCLAGRPGYDYEDVFLIKTLDVKFLDRIGVRCVMFLGSYWFSGAFD